MLTLLSKALSLASRVQTSVIITISYLQYNLWGRRSLSPLNFRSSRVYLNRQYFELKRRRPNYVEGSSCADTVAAWLLKVEVPNWFGLTARYNATANLPAWHGVKVHTVQSIGQKALSVFPLLPVRILRDLPGSSGIQPDSGGFRRSSKILKDSSKLRIYELLGNWYSWSLWFYGILSSAANFGEIAFIHHKFIQNTNESFWQRNGGTWGIEQSCGDTVHY